MCAGALERDTRAYDEVLARLSADQQEQSMSNTGTSDESPGVCQARFLRQQAEMAGEPKIAA